MKWKDSFGIEKGTFILHKMVKTKGQGAIASRHRNKTEMIRIMKKAKKGTFVRESKIFCNRRAFMLQKGKSKGSIEK